MTPSCGPNPVTQPSALLGTRSRRCQAVTPRADSREGLRDFARNLAAVAWRPRSPGWAGTLVCGSRPAGLWRHGEEGWGSGRVRAGYLGLGGRPCAQEDPGREAWSSGVPELRAWRSRGVLAGRAQGAADPGSRTPHAPGAERPGLSRILCSQGWVVREHPPPPPPRPRARCARRPEQRTWIEGLSYLEWKAH